jgi:hypothetical protein
MSIVKECMVVNLQIGVWNGYKLDKEVSRRVTTDANADSDAARVNKHLVPKEALKQITTAMGAIRTHFYDNTLPWKDNGDRLLTRKMYQRFIEEHGRLAGEFNDAVSQFLDVGYPAARDRAAFRMGEMFKVGDYPEPAMLRHKFYVNLDIDAVTEAGDFRVNMDKSVVDNIRAEMQDAMQARLGKAMGEVWARLADTLGHFANKMAGDEIFRDSTVNNLEEIVELLPDLNILNDANLESIRQEIKAAIIGYSPKELRKDATVRNVAATEAKRIMDNMAGFMKAFGGGSC